MIKKYLIVICFLLFSYVSVAQMSFSPIGTEYNYVTTDWMGLPAWYATMISQKDTIVDGIVNRKLIKIDRHKGSNESVYSSILIRQSNDSIFIDNIFMYNLASKVGDTTVINTKHYLILDSVGYKQIFSARRKVFYFRQGATYCPKPSQSFYFKQLTFVENYGPIDGYISLQEVEACLIGVFNRQKFTCGTYMGEKYVTLDYISEYCLPLQIKHKETKNLTGLYPNPANSFITVELADCEGQIKIFNALGAKVFEAPAIGDNSTINVEELQSGIYHVTINGVSNKALQFVKY